LQLSIKIPSKICSVSQKVQLSVPRVILTHNSVANTMLSVLQFTHFTQNSSIYVVCLIV